MPINSRGIVMRLLLLAGLLICSFHLNQYQNVKTTETNSYRKIASSYSASLCNLFKDADNTEKFNSAIAGSLNYLFLTYEGNLNRHVIGARLNQCVPSSNSKGLVVAFQGTGAFNPTAFHLMKSLANCDNYRSLNQNIRRNTYVKILRTLRTRGQEFSKWSGIEAGALSVLLEDQRYDRLIDQVQFATFASEEAEILAGPERLTSEWLSNFSQNFIRNTNFQTHGVNFAMTCVTNYLNLARANGMGPKLFIIGHSSGSRSIVKFLERFKDLYPLEADVVFTIDPVIEAQDAMEEVFSQLHGSIINDIANFVTFDAVPSDSRQPNVWTRNHPSKLYKTSNAKKWLSFFQNVDTRGFDAPIRFGIHGSPIRGADFNTHIREGLGDKAHGKITTHPRVLESFKEEFFHLMD